MDELIGKRVKIVFKDGDRNTLIRGVVSSIDSENKFLKLDAINGKSVYIQLESIDKIEPEGEQ